MPKSRPNETLLVTDILQQLHVVDMNRYTVKTLIKVTLFNNYVSKCRVSLEVEKVFCPLGVALLEGRILIGGISVTSSMRIRPAPRPG